MCAIFTKMSLTIFIMLYIVSTVLSKDDIRKHFESECGPDNPMTLYDCKPYSNDNFRCCFARGQEVLQSQSICVKVFDYENAQSRIDKVKELSTIATGVYLDCGNTKQFKSTCGVESPSSITQCTKAQTGNDNTECCYVKIKSENFNGASCKEFPHMDINTIGEAVDAAKTINVTLEVKCNATFMKIGYYMILIIMMII